MSDSSRSQILWAPEVTFNEVPNISGVALTKLRFTKENLKHKNSAAVSAEIRPDRMRQDLLLVGVDVDGAIDSEFSYSSFDLLIQAALCGTWTNLTNTFADGGTTNANPNLTSLTAAFTPSDVGKPIVCANYPAGTTILTYTSATSVVLSANGTATGTNVTFTIYNRQVSDLATTISTPNITSLTAKFTSADVGVPITATGIPAATTILSVQSATAATLSVNATATGSALLAQIGNRGQQLSNGVINRSFMFEKGYTDITQFIQFSGVAIEEWNLDITARRIVQQSIAFMGAKAQRSGATVGVGGPNAAPTNAPLAAGPFITLLETNTNMTGLKFKDFKLKVKNNLRIHDHVESTASDDFGRGVQDVTGSLTAYFKTGALYDQFLANGAISLQFAIQDPTTLRFYTIRIPVLKLPDVQQEIPSVDADVMQAVQWRALFDSVSGTHLSVFR